MEITGIDKKNPKKLLLHVCCAPDATVPLPALIGEGYFVCAYFYGNNIQPEEEYLKRLQSVKIMSDFFKADVFIEDYKPAKWLKKIQSSPVFAAQKEQGTRCSLCFALQLLACAKTAVKNNFTHLCTTLTISPHKNPALINAIGSAICAKYGLVWVKKIWRKDNGFLKSVQKSKELGLYRQNYCGCAFSKRIERSL